MRKRDPRNDEFWEDDEDGPFLVRSTLAFTDTGWSGKGGTAGALQRMINEGYRRGWAFERVLRAEEVGKVNQVLVVFKRIEADHSHLLAGMGMGRN